MAAVLIRPSQHRSRLRLFVLQVLFVSLFVTLFARLWYLQVFTGEEYQAKAAEQSVRDIVVQTGQRVAMRQLSGGALRSVLASVGLAVSHRVAGAAAGRWIPVIGAGAVAAYAYYDTLQVARTAIELLQAQTTDTVA